MRENKKYKIKNISRRNTASTSWPYRGTGVEHPSFTSDRLSLGPLLRHPPEARLWVSFQKKNDWRRMATRCWMWRCELEQPFPFYMLQ